MSMNKWQILLLALLSFHATGSSTGINGGMESSNMASDIVSVVQVQQIKQVCLFDADHQLLNALANTGIKVMVVFPHDQLPLIMQTQTIAADWIGKNIAPFIPATKIAYIYVGNHVLSAIQSLQAALLAVNLNSQVKVLSPQMVDIKSWDVIFPNGTALYSSLDPENMAKMERRLASAGSFCVANSNADMNALLAGINWACGIGGANCSAIQPGQPCYEANNLVALASYAYNDYYQKANANGGTCNFNNTAMLTTNDPSHGSCIFTSSSTGGLPSNTSGSGNVPPPPFTLPPSPYDNFGNGVPSLGGFVFAHLVPLIPVFWF